MEYDSTIERNEFWINTMTWEDLKIIKEKASDQTNTYHMVLFI